MNRLVKAAGQRCTSLISGVPKRIPLLWAILNEIDTITIRAVMSLSSLVFAIFLQLSHQSMSPKAYDLMEWVGPRWLWSLIFFIYGISTLRLIWDDTKRGIHRAAANLWTNIYGFVIWSFCISSMVLSAGYIPPLTAVYTIIIPFLGWSIYKTAGERRVR